MIRKVAELSYRSGKDEKLIEVEKRLPTPEVIQPTARAWEEGYSGESVFACLLASLLTRALYP
jgi:hypothetical protein